MTPRLACALGVASFGTAALLGLATRYAHADDVRAVPPPPKINLVNTNDPELKKKYPFVSLAPRLEYEKKRPIAKNGPSLTDDGKKRLASLEMHQAFMHQGDGRVYTLYLLHRDEVKDFTKREGFGLRRMLPRRTPLDLPTGGSIAFDPAPATEPIVGPAVALPKEQSTSATDTAPALPSVARLEDLHRGGLFNFVNFPALGLVKTRQQVAGFASHHFASMPRLDLRLPDTKDAPKERWKIRRLELVSLLKHEQPAVYLSESLPRMDELKSAPTRKLNAFEEQGLKGLRAGEDLVLNTHVNQIRMLGSMRATKTCIQCHDVERGELLGAFSYLLQRDPPAAVEK